MTLSKNSEQTNGRPSLSSGVSLNLNKDELALLDQLKAFLGESLNHEVAIATIKNISKDHTSNPPDPNTVMDVYFNLISEENNRNRPVLTCANRPPSSSNSPVTAKSYSSAVQGISTPRSQTRPSTVQTQTRPSTVQTQTTADVVDLTNDEDDMQKAIAASIADTDTKGSREDRDMNKAIMESLQANQHIVGFSPFGQTDSENPHEREREGMNPVGLKNIGNSCWFNVIVQTLYNLPLLREKLFNFRCESTMINVPDLITGNVNDKAESLVSLPDDCPESDRVRLLLSLRRLFALLMVSERKYIDPTETVHLISQLSTEMNAPPSVGIQQDATEMLLRVIEWLENAFTGPTSAPSVTSNDEKMDQGLPSMSTAGDEQQQQVPSAPSPPSFSLNHTNVRDDPMKYIFHGSHVEERIGSDGVVSTSTVESSLQLVNLDVSFDNLHESLDATLWPEPSTDTCQIEQWLLTVPPVVVFSLRRFAYNKQSGRTEKLHNRFRFPVHFYIDRYLNGNRDVVGDIRRRCGQLKEELSTVKAELARYNEYPIGDTTMPIMNILRSAMIYTTGVDVSRGHGEPMETNDELEIGGRCARDFPCSVLSTMGLSAHDVDSMRNVLMETCKRTMATVKELEEKQTALLQALNQAYDTDALKQCAYRLHSVIIHEGEASVGHYWAYIADFNTLDDDRLPVAWRKYNDKTVEPATWSQVEEDAFGSRTTCSAYCLVYVRRDQSDVFEHDMTMVCKSELWLAVPNDLQEAVIMDNTQFKMEMEKWDEKHRVPSVPVDSPSTAGQDRRRLEEEETLAESIKLSTEMAYYYHSKAAFTTAQLTVRQKQLEKNETLDENQLVEREMNEYVDRMALILDQSSKSTSTTNDEKKNTDLLYLPLWCRLIGFTLSSTAERIFAVQALLPSPEPLISERAQIFIETQRADSTKQDDFNALNVANGHFRKFLEMIVLTHSNMKGVVQHIKALDMETKWLKYVCVMYDSHEQLRAVGSNSAFPLLSSALFNNILCVMAVRFTRMILHRIEMTAEDITADERRLITAYYRPILVRIAHLQTPMSKTAVEYIQDQWKTFVTACEQHPLVGVVEVFQEILDTLEQKTVPDFAPILYKLRTAVERVAWEIQMVLNIAEQYNLIYDGDERPLIALQMAIDAAFD